MNHGMSLCTSRWALIALCFVAPLSFACRSADPTSSSPAAELQKPKVDPSAVDFNDMVSGQAPVGFSSARTGAGEPGVWLVKDDGTSNRVLAQVSEDETDKRFPLCVFDGFSAADVNLSCRFKTIDGGVDQAAGLVARYSDEQNYYVLRANALEGNVRFYHFIAGVRTQLGSAKLEISGEEWHDLRLNARGSHFEVFLDGNLLFAVDDSAISTAGKVGVWTKADSVTWFDDLRFTAKMP